MGEVEEGELEVDAVSAGEVLRIEAGSAGGEEKINVGAESGEPIQGGLTNEEDRGDDACEGQRSGKYIPEARPEEIDKDDRGECWLNTEAEGEKNGNG